MVDRNEQKQQLLREIGDALVADGFDRRLKSGVLWRSFPGGRNALFIDVTDLNDSIQVVIKMGIRFEQLEDMTNADSDYLTKREKADTYTLGAEMGNISTGRQKYWLVRNEGDIAAVVPEIVSAVRKISLPYFSKYSDLECAYEVLLRDDNVAWKQAPFDVARAKSAVGLAKLLGKVAELPELIEAKRAYLESRNDPDIGEFEAFVERRIVS